MKKKYISLFCFILVSLSAFSQNVKGKLILGISGGQIDGDKFHGYHKPGPIGGFAAEFMISERWTIQPEIYYTLKGARKVDSLNYYKWQINNIEAPILLNCYLIKNKLMLQGGPAIDYLLSSRVFPNGGGGFVNITPSLKPITFSYIFGVEYKLSDKFGFNIRYSYSIGPINKTQISSDNGTIGSNYNYYTNTLSFTIRYLLSKVK